MITNISLASAFVKDVDVRYLAGLLVFLGLLLIDAPLDPAEAGQLSQHLVELAGDVEQVVQVRGHRLERGHHRLPSTVASAVSS